METIYVVTGATGKWSDRTEWMVAAYRDERLAMEHVTKADEAARVIEGNLGGRRWDVSDGISPYDPYMLMDYTGTHYYYEPMKLREELPHER